MSLLLFSVIIASRAEAAKATTDLTGSAYEVIDASPDSDSQVWKASVWSKQTGGTSPTLNGKIETSWDNVTWFNVGSFTEATADKEQIVDLSAVGKYVRAKWVAGGTAKASWYGQVRLLSSGRFKVKAAT
jgi:hypothetical protein